MSKQDLKLAVDMLKKTAAFQCQQIGYRKLDNELIVTTNCDSGNFHNLQIVPLFQIFSMYIAYNKEMGQCELHIF